MHEGTVSLESKENEGSLFRVTIPYKEVSTASPSLTGVSVSEGAMEVPTAPERDSMAEQKEDGGQKENLLIVEDNEELKTLLQHSLEDSYQVRIAEDGGGGMGNNPGKNARPHHFRRDDAQHGWV